MKTFNIIKGCPCCGSTHFVTIREVDLQKFESGENILVAMPSPLYTATQREQMISGFCPDCIRKTFGVDEEEEEDANECERESLDFCGQWW